ncbi:SusC/RagA family TonB-linked outer membrane protein [Sphingobacterium sp. lm-10]|uniref:SusC/RagA family TonB-linked outer membrane protein n=1 Tax=Sphingobacterium sp. lm-10 TaxID=2944904 RepID=UPI002020FAA4|nr:SusC/RagA family TonB-linked outer membrane protein [Sphingobacterium sp. lm-10]MCL7989195.1 SusC/RagA family TonB-linked outer membrane protein [Sphingobacterium sp. lm-10]
MMSKFTLRSVMSFSLFMVLFASAYAQTSNLSGRVTTRSGEAVQGATVRVLGSQIAASTDATGAYTISGIPVGNRTITAEIVGFETASQATAIAAGANTLNFQLNESSSDLEEVVVIGYGTQRRDQLTGSITAIGSKDFQTGVITTPEQLIQGKAAGVQITSSGGRPGSGSTVRIRAGASLNASNDPLYVIDGVPFSPTTVAGTASPMSLINPNDIESFTVLKDANATAIYGSRASNGVVLITTKKGASGAPRINFSTVNSFSTIDKYYDVMSADSLRSYVNTYGTAAQIARLGEANTDWQREIFRTAFTTDNNVSIAGAYKGLPYRASVGYLNQQGVLKRDVMDRTSASLSVTPKFFNNSLKVDLNLKGSLQNSMFANDDAIGSAIVFDPTQPVYQENAYGNYFEYMQGDVPHPLAPRNPLAMIDLKDDDSKVARSFGNIQLDYSTPFIPGLRANLNLGYDISRGQGDVFVPDFAALNNTTQGLQTRYMNDYTNLVGEFYLNYNKNFSAINGHLDATAGYGYYDYKTLNRNYPSLRADGSVLTEPVFPRDIQQNRLISYFGRATYTANEKYIISGTLRTDGSSRYSPENRWGVFPSAGVTWRINRESFLEEVTTLSKLNLRLSYGVTGQQDGIANYSYLPNYYLSVNEAQYQFGDEFYRTYSPIAYDADLRWESTATYNAGVDFGILGDRIDGSIDVYRKRTRDLLSTIPIPIGTNFSNRLLTNVGNMENTGVEFNLNAIPIRREDFSWNVNFNFTYNTNKVTNLTAVDDPNYFVEVGGITGGTGQNVQAHVVGYSPFTYRLQQQIYGPDGRPLEGVYADLNGDGVGNDADRSLFGSPLPRYLLGFSTGIDYKNWTFSTVLRANLGQHVYDNISSNLSVRNNVLSPIGIINNAPSSLTNTNFINNRALSNFYLHDGSFLRMDNISVGYNFQDALGQGKNIRVSGNVQNVFVLSGYRGIDPEIQDGIDNNLYPRPRTFVLGINLDL